MQVFISSLIGGMAEIRSAVREAIESLGHQPIMAEDFSAGPDSPQVACLAGLRRSAVVVLILGHDYGEKQASGLSATHEEYRDAKGQRPVIAFRLAGSSPDPDQAAFIAEVENWEAGLFRGSFASAGELRTSVTRALHEWELSKATGPIDSEALLAEAVRQIPQESRGYSQTGLSLWLSMSAGPRQTVLRPSELEADQLRTDLMKEAVFGQHPIFDSKSRSDSRIEDDALVVFQERKGASVHLSSNGDILIKTPISLDGLVVIEEAAGAGLQNAIGYATWILDRLDPTQRISVVAIAVALRGSDMVVWRTQEEHDRSPNSYSMGMNQQDRVAIHLNPPTKARSALNFDRKSLSEDLITLLRRQAKGKN